MLDINLEYRKGVLFVRLGGVFNENTYKKISKNLKNIIIQGGIKYLVFNLKDVLSIDENGIESIIDNCRVVNKNNGKTMICKLQNEDVKRKIESNNIFDLCYEISDELSAFNLVNI